MNKEIKRLSHWKKRIIVTAWVTYASFYLIRVNFSVAIPGIIEEFGITKTEIGFILSALFFAYAFGQFVNGQLSDKFGSRKIVFIGLLVSSVINIIFGFTSGWLAGMILLWALNGYFQSMGWSPVVKTIAGWFPPPNKRQSFRDFGLIIYLRLCCFMGFGWFYRWRPGMALGFSSTCLCCFSLSLPLVL